jgi:hypothetical protein
MGHSGCHRLLAIGYSRSAVKGEMPIEVFRIRIGYWLFAKRWLFAAALAICEVLRAKFG